MSSNVKPDSELFTEESVNENINRFEKWFCANVDPSTTVLSGIEVAIIKTYLWWENNEKDSSNE